MYTIVSGLVPSYLDSVQCVDPFRPQTSDQRAEIRSE